MGVLVITQNQGNGSANKLGREVIGKDLWPALHKVNWRRAIKMD